MSDNDAPDPIAEAFELMALTLIGSVHTSQSLAHMVGCSTSAMTAALRAGVVLGCLERHVIPGRGCYGYTWAGWGPAA